jgi:hypothetical protein
MGFIGQDEGIPTRIGTDRCRLCGATWGDRTRHMQLAKHHAAEAEWRRRMQLTSHATKNTQAFDAGWTTNYTPYDTTAKDWR